MSSGIIPKDWVLLWENSNPSNAFAEQTVNINLTDYQYAAIQFMEETTPTVPYIFPVIIGKNTFASLDRVWASSGGKGGGGVYQRYFTFTNGGISFDGCRSLAFNSWDYSTTDNNHMKPHKIFGVKI